MPLSKRRRLFTPKKHKSKPITKEAEEPIDDEVSTPRSRLKGALREIAEPVADDSDGSSEEVPVKRDSQDQKEESSDEDSRKQSQRQSYVLKLFDRSVDLSQFSEDSPLYPICRAWIVNQPKATYKDIGKSSIEDFVTEDTIELPRPEGPPLSKIPNLLPEQQACNKDNINLNYHEAPPPSKEQLLHEHMIRWTNIRTAWLEQAALVESRYNSTQEMLNKINVNAL